MSSALVPGDRSLVRLLLYTVANALWSTAALPFLTLAALWTCIESCGMRRRSWAARGLYPVRAVTQTLWRIEIYVHALYDTKADLRLVALDDVAPGHAGWTLVYVLCWRSVQVGFYDSVAASIMAQYTAMGTPASTYVPSWASNLPPPMTPAPRVEPVSPWAFAGTCLFFFLVNWIAVTIFVWVTKQSYYAIFGQLVIARVDGSQHPLLPTITSPPAPSYTVPRATGAPAPYLLPFARAPPLGPPPAYEPTLAAKSSSSASEPGGYHYKLVERNGTLGFPVPPPPMSASSPPTKTLWTRLFAKSSAVDAPRNVSRAEDSEDLVSVDATPLEVAPRIKIVPPAVGSRELKVNHADDRPSPVLATMSRAPIRNLDEDASPRETVADVEAEPMQGRIIFSQVIAPSTNRISIRVDDQLANATPGVALRLGLPLPQGEVRCAYVILAVGEHSIDVLVADASASSLWLCKATIGTLVCIYGIDATLQLPLPTTNHVATVSNQSDVEEDEDFVAPPTDVVVVPQPPQLAGWVSPTTYAPAHTYGALTPLGVASASFTSDFTNEGPEYGALSPTAAMTSTEAFALPQVTRALSVDPTSIQDRVHFTAYAPPTVVCGTTFTFSIWAFLVHQRSEMHEEATADGNAVQLSRDVLLRVRRGALVHVTLTTPDGFVLCDEPTQVLAWHGDVTRVAFRIECGAFVDVGQVMFSASIVVGAEVLRLRSYVFVSASALPSAALDPATEVTCDLERLPPTYEEIPFGELEMKNLVGRGNFGDAYRARYRGQDVVVKTLRPSEFGDNQDQIVQEFRHEAAVLSLFGHHPNIVPFVGACTDLSQLSLVTEYLPFGSLEDQSREHTLSTEQKTRLLYDAANGFLNIHEGGFIHRDIAARNCLVDDGLRAKICDFGLCRRVRSFGGSHFPEGMVPLKYMAPESLTPPHAFSYQSDAYSFGVLVWETYMETPPYANVPSHLAAARILEGARLDVDAASIPEVHRAFLAACFQEDPSKRPSMTDIVRHFASTQLPT